MNNERPPISDWPSVLAGFADGELDSDTRRQLAEWLIVHPEALADLQDQESLARGNDALWQAVAPPLPSAGRWSGVFNAIVDETMPRPKPVRKRINSGRLVAVLGSAAMLLVGLIVWRLPQAPVPTVVPVELAVNTVTAEPLEVFPVATDDDVELIQLPEAAARLVVVGRHPMADVPLLLAVASDVQLLNFGPDESGNLPNIEDTRGPDISMLWAPSAKP